MGDRLLTATGVLVLASLLGCVPASVRNVGHAPGYSIHYVKAEPEPGTVLLTGHTVTFTVTVEYGLWVSQTGRIVLVIEDENSRLLFPTRTQVAKLVERGSGQATLTDTVTLPQGVRKIQLFIPLAPEGYAVTRGEILIVYPVRSPP